MLLSNASALCAKPHSMIKKMIIQHRRLNVTLLDQAMVSGVNFLTGILIARFLGIKAFGVFTLVWMAVLFVNSIQMAMISAPMMTVGPKQSDAERPSYYGAVVIHQLIFSFLSCGFLWVGVMISDQIYPEWHIVQLALPLSAALFFFQNQDFLRRVFFTECRANTALANDAVSYLGRIGLLLLLFSTANTTTADVLWVVAVTSALAVAVGLSTLENLSFSRRHLWPVFKRHWILSKWMTASAVLQWTSGNYFILVAGSLLGPAAVGALKAAQNIIGITHILFQGLDNIVPATASRHFSEEGVKGLKRYLIKVALWGGGATLVIAFAVSLFPDDLLRLVYGEQYDGYGYILRWYALCYVLMFFSLPLRAGLRVLEASKPIFITYVLMTVFSILFSWKIVERWGMEGAMFGILTIQMIMLSSLFYHSKLSLRKASM